jgi:hypothetical protein
MTSPEKINDYYILDLCRADRPKLAIKMPKPIMQIYYSKDTQKSLEYWSEGPSVDILSEFGEDPNYLCLRVGENDTLCRFSLHRWEKDILDDQEFLEKLKVGLKFIDWYHGMGYYETIDRTFQRATQTLSEFTAEIDAIKKEITPQATL